jgi:hypothetical protein
VAQARSIFRLNRDVEAFLYAPIDQDQGGMPVSVLSALARLDIDPWEEAERLAALPKYNAERRLAQLMTHVSGAARGPHDPEALATRLVELLPDRRGMRHYELPEGFLSTKTTGMRIGFLMGVLIGLQWFATSCQPLSQQSSSAPPTSTNSSPAQFGVFGQ